MKILKKVILFISFLPITVLIVNLIIAFIYGNGGYDFSGELQYLRHMG